MTEAAIGLDERTTKGEATVLEEQKGSIIDRAWENWCRKAERPYKE